MRVGRYVVERELAHGAMGMVYRVHDPVAGRAVALKRFLGDSTQRAQMFEREYHALNSLRHPRIIEVFDYGVADGIPYYTMELLDGADLRELAPLPFARACAYLRDVASSLGLLHARRMLHRDISPRNVRVTGDDRAKLIDFGGLTSFGVPELVVGTPPCVPPEALHRVALDQRADLYALGALGYHLLTGRHAYRARELAELPQAWRTVPVRPSALAETLALSVPSIPADLDALIMSLLTLDPLGRPASAAEVIDRLEQIAGLAREHDEATSRSYLLGAATVGRDYERERLRKRLRSACKGAGSAIVLEGASGTGRTRLLAGLAIEAQLAGALPLLVDAQLERGANGIVHALIAKLHAALPDATLAACARSTESQQALLARFSPVLQRAFDEAPDATDFSVWPGELRKRTQAALTEWLLAISRHTPLVLAVDNAEATDDGSAALLTTLSTRTPGHALLIAAATRPLSELEPESATARALRSLGARVTLVGLDPADVHALVRQLFGDVPHTGRLADWMHRLSAGNPRGCMDLATDLVERGIVRYIDGAWVLPQLLPAAELPRSLDALIADRVARLDVSARQLAEALAVHHGALSLQHCLALAEQLAIAAPHDVLRTLGAEGLVLSASERPHFAHEAVRKRVLDSIPEARRRALHRVLGDLLERADTAQDTRGLLDAGWHLLHGGEEARGAALLAEAGLRLTYASDEMGAAVPALRAALEVCRRRKRPVSEQLRLLTPLTMAGYYSDRRLADELGEETLLLYRRHLGFDLAARLRPLLGRHLSMYTALALTGARFLLSAELGGIAGLQKRIVDYFACCTAMTGVAAICLDAATARRRASYLEPLAVLGRDHAASVAYRFASILTLIPEDRPAEVIEGCSRLLKRLDDPRPIRDVSPALRTLLHGGVLYALASMDAAHAQSKVLEHADRLERMGLQLYEMVADQLRTIYHALRGEVELAELYRGRVELHAVQAGSAWQAEVWAPCAMILVNVLTQDTIGLKRTVEQLDRLGKEIPSLALHARMARAEYHFLKGEHEAGLAIAGPELAAVPARGFIGYRFSMSNQAHALNRLGRHAEAKALLEPWVEGLTEAERALVGYFVNLSRELAHAYCGLGDYVRAFAIVDDLLERHGASSHPLVLGNLNSTAAAIAIAAEDVPRAIEHLARMEQAFRPTANPALIAQWEHLRREVRRLVDARAPDLAPELDALDSAGGDTSVSVRSLLGEHRALGPRAQLALELMLKQVHGTRGFLFTYHDGELSLIAPEHGAEPQTELIERLQRDIEQDLTQDQVTVVERVGRSPLPPPLQSEPRRTGYRTYTLSIPVQGALRVVGAVAIEVGPRTWVEPQAGFLQAIANALFGEDVTDAEPRTR